MGQQPMDTSDFLGKIANLESSLDRFEFWLTFATALVILGLILVCGFEIREAIATLKKQWSWKPLGVIAGGILITVGVAGELALQFFASSQQTALRKANHAVVAAFQKEAADARERASNAEEHTAQIEKDEAQLRKDTEDERLARVKIEERVAWRKLDPKAQSEIALHLSRFAKEPVLIAYNPNDMEALSFASDIAATFHAAGWEVAIAEPVAVRSLREEPAAFGANRPLAAGVLVWRSDDEVSRKAATALVEQLSLRGFDATISPEQKGLLALYPTSTRVVLTVAHKPDGAQGEFKLKAHKKNSQ
jgi:hypothetical protein